LGKSRGGNQWRCKGRGEVEEIGGFRSSEYVGGGSRRQKGKKSEMLKKSFTNQRDESRSSIKKIPILRLESTLPPASEGGEFNSVDVTAPHRKNETMQKFPKSFPFLLNGIELQAWDHVS